MNDIKLIYNMDYHKHNNKKKQVTKMYMQHDTTYTT